MSVLPNRIYRDLAGEIRGDVHVGLPVRAVYSSAACIYRIMPLAVARPRDSDDVAKVVQYAAERGVPITPRGGGSGVAGHSIGPGIILDFSTHMNDVIAEGDDWIEVQPGIVLDNLNARLAHRGKRFSPDPSSGAFATIGGMIANNSSGARGIRFGSTRNHVIALELVTADGTITRTDSTVPPDSLRRLADPFETKSRFHRDFSSGNRPAVSKGRAEQWVERMKGGIGKILDAHRGDIESHRPRVTKNSSGYELSPVIAQIITGSEGTLAVVTAARLKVLPLPSLTGAALLHFRDPQSAMDAVPRLRENAPTAIEIMDAAFLEIVRNGRRDLGDLLPDEGRTMLLVEHEADDDDELRVKLAQTAQVARSAGAERIDASADEAGMKRLWAVRKAGSPIISSIKGPIRPLRFVEDMVVPPERLAEFADRFVAILTKHNCAAPIIGHAGDGNIHVNPRLDLRDPGLKTTIRRIADEVYALVDRYGGSLSGEHGDGRLRAPYLKNHFGDGVYRAFGEIKSLFDPKGILNPGVILGDGEITDNLRYGVPAARTMAALDEPRVRENSLQCHGCGECRDDCPVCRVTVTEEMSPRGRVNLARAITNGEISAEEARSDPQAIAAIEACLGCARCEAGCSSGVDIPDIISRLKTILPGVKTIRGSILGNPRIALAPLSRLHPVANALLNNSPSRNLLCAVGGLNPDMRLPDISGPSLKIAARKYTADIASADVIYFPGCYATFVDPQGVGLSTLYILESLGLKPRIATFGCCGMSMLAHGDIEGAHRAFEAAIAELNAAPGVPIIASCPSCLRMLRRGGFQTRPYNTMSTRLRSAESHIEQNLGTRTRYVSPDFANPAPEGTRNEHMSPLDMRVAIQTPCHQRDGNDSRAVRKLLGHIKGITVIELPDTCCGMGGTTGLMAENRELTRSIGDELLEALKKSRADAVVSSCGSCRIALAAAAKDMHPLTLLAESMGFQARGLNPLSGMTLKKDKF